MPLFIIVVYKGQLPFIAINLKEIPSYCDEWDSSVQKNYDISLRNS